MDRLSTLNRLRTDKLRVKAKTIVYALVFLLVFEGLVRKLLPSAIGLVIFFLKDVLCIYALTLVLNLNFKGLSNTILKSWKIIFIAFIPCIIQTALHDPVLAIFGIKQYLLYIVVGLLVPIAFPPSRILEFRTFLSIFIFLLIPTALIAIVQNSLPATHWLNRSVDGDSLEGFSAAGYLRVSSTFAFTGQYSWFLDVVCGFFAATFFFPSFKRKKKYLNILLLSLAGLSLGVGAFITGGRTAVLGCGGCLLIGFIFASIKSPGRFVLRGIAMIAVFFMLLGVIRAVKPEFFAAYDARSTGTEERSHSQEIEGRVSEELFAWVGWLFRQDLLPMLFGRGLGVMSNGSDKISAYAAVERSFGAEADYITTAWEGGVYLMIIWYGFRIWAIFFCIRIWVKSVNLGVPIAFLLGFVIIIGLYSFIAKQPPLNIWFWLTIGSIITLKNFDDERERVSKKRLANRQPQPML
ncbi:hypothetical protein MUY27_10970 [Mucilaginibacter sp. RS28]|uniref:Uncharacterized protein n=1 Tax=Mucilaginibacter straminoryzae TaxID=2932774 RepID=A0A9X1X334_9SPHI|nr:hypothetical protein [Mucilaginibacter straminoryzae]MCJ8210234.1 hypothetical protein [Mucilaginibacter straminoryzae]